jgi:hypothetical protein
METAAKRTSSSCRCIGSGPQARTPVPRLPPPSRNQIAVNIMSPSNLDNTGPWRQTLFHDLKLLGTRPPPSPLRTGQNRNRRHVCSFACELMSKSSHAQTRSGKAASTGALPIYEKVNGFFAGQGDAGKFKRDLDDANKNSVPMRFVPGSREENSQYAAGR